MKPLTAEQLDKLKPWFEMCVTDLELATCNSLLDMAREYLFLWENLSGTTRRLLEDLELNVAVAKALGLEHRVESGFCGSGGSEQFKFVEITDEGRLRLNAATDWNDAMWAAEKAFSNEELRITKARRELWYAAILTAGVSRLRASDTTGPRAICQLILREKGFTHPATE